MADDSMYDMRKKLLDLQNELLKGAAQEKHEIVHKAPEPAAPAAHPTAQHTSHELSQNDLIAVLKDLRSNQQKILSALAEISNKIK